MINVARMGRNENPFPCEITSYESNDATKHKVFYYNFKIQAYVTFYQTDGLEF